MVLWAAVAQILRSGAAGQLYCRPNKSRKVTQSPRKMHTGSEQICGTIAFLGYAPFICDNSFSLIRKKGVWTSFKDLYQMGTTEALDFHMFFFL